MHIEKSRMICITNSFRKYNLAYIFILAKHQSGGAFQIVDYYNMANVKNTDIERITTKYDCDCIVSILFRLAKYMKPIND